MREGSGLSSLTFVPGQDSSGYILRIPSEPKVAAANWSLDLGTDNSEDQDLEGLSKPIPRANVNELKPDPSEVCGSPSSQTDHAALTRARPQTTPPYLERDSTLYHWKDGNYSIYNRAADAQSGQLRGKHEEGQA